MFQWRSLPTVEKWLLDFLFSPNIKLAKAAARALSRSNSILIREEALRLVLSEKPEMIATGIQILENSYLKEDSKPIYESLKFLKDSEHRHFAGINIKDICKKSGGPELRESIIWLYENGPDSFCRGSFLKLLLEWNNCPEEIAWEAQWDCASETTMIARNASTKFS